MTWTQSPRQHDNPRMTSNGQGAQDMGEIQAFPFFFLIFFLHLIFLHLIVICLLLLIYRMGGWVPHIHSTHTHMFRLPPSSWPPETWCSNLSLKTLYAPFPPSPYSLILVTRGERRAFHPNQYNPCVLCVYHLSLRRAYINLLVCDFLHRQRC